MTEPNHAKADSGPMLIPGAGLVYMRRTAMNEVRRLRFLWRHIERLTPAGRDYLRARLADPKEEARMSDNEV